MLFASIALSIVLFAPVVNDIGGVVTTAGQPAAAAANARVDVSSNKLLFREVPPLDMKTNSYDSSFTYSTMKIVS